MAHSNSGYHSLYWAEVFLHIVTFPLFLQNKVGKIYLYIKAFNKTIFQLALVGYKMNKANIAPLPWLLKSFSKN